MTFPFIIGASQQKRSGRPFIIKVNYASGFTVTLPLATTAGYNYNFIVDWGDGSVSQVISATDVNRIHTYASGGTYTITMTGTLEGFLTDAYTGLREYLVEVVQWGRTRFKLIRVANSTRLVSTYGILQTTYLTSLAAMFSTCTSLTTCEVGDWDVSTITNFGNVWPNGMFHGCNKLTTVDVSNWVFNSTSNIAFSDVFAECTSLTTLDVSGWNTGKIVSFDTAFRNTKITTLDVSGWDVSNCTNFGNAYNYAMFFQCTSLTSLDLSNWVFSTTSNIYFSPFYSCSNLTTVGDTSGWNTEKIYSFSSAFQGCGKLSAIDVSTWDLSNCRSLNSIFLGCGSLTTLAVSNWNVSNVTNFGSAFAGCSNITSFDLVLWNVGNATIFGSAFSYCGKLTTIGDVSGWNTSKVTDVSFMFRDCLTLTSIDVGDWDVSKITNFTHFINNCSVLTSIGDVSGWVFNSTSNITFNAAFANCPLLTTLDVTNWNMNKAVDIYGIFYQSTSLSTLNVTNWDVSNVTNFRRVFTKVPCSSIDVSSWNVTKGTTFNEMFFQCPNLTSLDLSGWVLNTTSNVDLSLMFSHTPSLTTIGDITGWNTSKVTTCDSMFNSAAGLTSLNISGLNFSTCTTFNSMFNGCTGLTSLNVSGWTLNSTSNINMSYIFQYCTSLTSIDITSWTMTKVTNTTNMFSACTALTSLTVPSSLTRVDAGFATGCSALTVYNFHRATAPTVSGIPFGNYAKPLHVPVSNSGYNIAPWTNTAIFSSIIADL